MMHSYHRTAEKVSQTGYSRHRENRENGRKKFPVRENTGNLVKTQGKHREYFFAQVVNALILKVSDICRKKKSFFFQKLDRSAKSVLCM